MLAPGAVGPRIDTRRPPSWPVMGHRVPLRTPGRSGPANGRESTVDENVPVSGPPLIESCGVSKANPSSRGSHTFGRGTCSRSDHLGHTQVCNCQLEVALVEHLCVCFLTARSSDPVQLVLVPLHRFDAVESRRGHATTGCSVD